MEIDNLAQQIENGKFTFKNSEIYLSASEFDYLNFENIKHLLFENCTFYGDFSLSHQVNKNFTLFFKYCSFINAVQITQCEFDTLTFLKIYKASEISILEGVFRRISFTSEKEKDAVISKIDISAKILSTISFSDFKLKGDLYLSYGSIIEDNNSYFTFNNSEFDNFQALFMNFGRNTTFDRCKIKDSFNLYNCTFNYISFARFAFPNNSNFNDTNFNKYTNLKSCSSQSEQSQLNIQNCVFKELVEFDYSTISLIDIMTTTFEQASSFQGLKVKSIRISKSTFSKPAFFDDLKIYNISNLKIKDALFIQPDLKITLRTIKHELQKTENRIDFNRFKNYEMAVYYEELNWRKDFTDKFILATTKITTDFGNSWTKAFWFTLISGLISYSVFFISEKHQYPIDFNSWQDFGKGYIRFFLVTDFYNPLEEDRTYIKSFWSWIPFIIGKIVIAFGIYEMIQSFRKFKA